MSPFGYKRGEGIDAGAGEPEWIVNKERDKYDAIFKTLNPCDGKITGAGNCLVAFPFYTAFFINDICFKYFQRPDRKW